MIVTLAGHVDHGKTSIVRALTGIDTDRLDEEKRRGLTIDLGFAYADFGGVRVGFVDVPGHHRFIHNMVAGVGRRQHALLVVAADDGVMPQTREHLQILALIGLTGGVVALNKIDRVAPARVAEVRSQVHALAADTFLGDAPVIEVACQDGRGIAALRHHLAGAAERHAVERAALRFRLAVDRAFSVRGAGVVVTGTVASGTARPGDVLAIAASGSPTRLRGLRVQDAAAELAVEGDRAAMNLAGIDLAEVARGDWIVAPEAAGTTASAAVDLQVLQDFPRAVRHWAPVHAYVATSHTQARVALLEGSPVPPGGCALVDVVFDERIHLKAGDRLILRDQDLGCTLGGGVVIDPRTPAGRRRAGVRQARLAALREADAATALKQLARLDVVELTTFQADWNLTEAGAADAARRADVAQRGGRLMDGERLANLRQAVLDAIARHHATQPESQGMTPHALARALEASAAAVDWAIEDLVESEAIRSRSGHFALAGHVTEVPPNLAHLFERIRPLLDTTQPPSLGDLAKSLGRPLPHLEKDLRALAGLGFLTRVSANRYYLKERLLELAAVARHLDADGPFSVRQFRDASGVGRNVVIEVLEHLDRHGVTRREGDLRQVVGDAERAAR